MGEKKTERSSRMSMPAVVIAAVAALAATDVYAHPRPATQTTTPGPMVAITTAAGQDGG
jgi:hypothetical protein